MVAAVFTHKLVAISTTLSVSGALILGLSHPKTRHSPTIRRLFVGTIGVLGILTVLQLFYLTGFASTVLFRLFSLSAQSSTPSIPTAAVDPYTIPARLFRISSVVLIAVVSGLVWIRWFWRSLVGPTRKRDIFFLGFVFPLAGLVVLLYPRGVNPTRTIFYSAVLLLVLIVVGLYWLHVESPTPSHWAYRYGAVGVVFLLIVSCGVSPIAGPDFSPLNRNYLTAQEVKAKEWGYENVPSTIATDQYYASQIPPSRIATMGSTVVSTSKFKDRTDLYLNNSFPASSPFTLAYRRCVTNLRSSYGVWRPTYNASGELNARYSRIYDSGCVDYFDTI